MTVDEETDIEFYKGSGAKNVLNRFEFSEEEKKLINNAIRTAHMKYPRMKIIREANDLLKEIAKVRKPKSTDVINVEEKAQVDIFIQSLEYQKNNSIQNKTKKYEFSIFGYKMSRKFFSFLLGAVITLILLYVQNNIIAEFY